MISYGDLLLKIIENTIPDDCWTERLDAIQTSTLYQTSEYAEYLQNSNENPIFVKFYNDSDNLVGQILITDSNNSQNEHGIKNFLKKFSKKNSSTLKFVHGPIILDNKYQDEIIQTLKEYLISKNKHISGSAHPLSNISFSTYSKPFSISKWSTFLIDLSLELDDILKKMNKHSARKNIERAEKKGVYVREISKSDLKLMFDLRQKTINSRYSNVSLSELERRWDSLHLTGWTGFLAEWKNIPIGGIMISHFNGYINESGILRSSLDYDEKLYAQDLLKWSIIKWGKKHQCHYYDLSGVNPNPQNLKEQGIFRYKQKWGGTQYNYDLIKL